MNYVDVLLPLPLEGTYTYSLPDTLPACRMGMRVLVPLGKSKVYSGLVMRVHQQRPSLPDDKIRAVLSVLDAAPVVLPEQLKLWHWIADYYMCMPGEVFAAALPSGLKADKGFKPKMESYVTLAPAYRSRQGIHMAFDMMSKSARQQNLFACYLQLSHWDDEEEDEKKEITREELLNVSHELSSILTQIEKKGILIKYDREVGRLNDNGDPHPERVRQLSTAQAEAYHGICQAWRQHPTVLLHGVTSSGKTEIYIKLIQEVIDSGKQVMYLLPEIALTVQIMERLQRVFGRRIGIYHSRYSDAERVEIWQKQLSDQPYDIILGARSAVFLPWQRLGLVIVDEEHETSYKQEDPAPRYHARSVALVLARMYGAKTLLGTATPSAETEYNAETGKYGVVRLMRRFKGVELPEVEVVDVKDLRRRKMMQGPFSPQLLKAVREALEQHRQVILFQNRRGYAPSMMCRVCGWVPHCPNCDVSLTFHKRLNLLTCHVCGHTEPLPLTCPSCDSPMISDRGFGTEKIEDEIRLLFPEARVARMDQDTTRTRHAQERIIDDFTHGRTDILIGTQMISKGLDFDRVSIVAILDADAMLNFPDFRAYEEAFMMMAQVAGRAGRRGERGKVVLQTRQPGLPVIADVVGMNYTSFYKNLFEEREAFHYPPFTRLCYVYLRHKNEDKVETAAQDLGGRLRRHLGDRVLGPDKPSVARIKQLFLRKIVLKLEPSLSLSSVRSFLHTTRQMMMGEKAYKTVQIFFDVDPL